MMHYYFHTLPCLYAFILVNSLSKYQPKLVSFFRTHKSDATIFVVYVVINWKTLISAAINSQGRLIKQRKQTIA